MKRSALLIALLCASMFASGQSKRNKWFHYNERLVGSKRGFTVEGKIIGKAPENVFGSGYALIVTAKNDTVKVHCLQPHVYYMLPKSGTVVFTNCLRAVYQKSIFGEK